MSNCSKGSIDKKIYDFKVLSKNFDGKILTSEIPENQVIDLKRPISFTNSQRSISSYH